NTSRSDRFRLIVADASRADTSEIAIAIGAPEALVARSTFSDVGTGNGNGVLDPGETASYAFTIGNDGGARLRSVTIQIQNPAAGVTIVDPSASLGNIAAGAAVTAPALRFSVTTPPAGRLFDLRIQDFYGHVWTQPIERVAPSTPSGLHVASSTIDRLSLSWDAVAAADLAGYHVFRGPNDGSTPVRITTLPVRRIPAYEDAGLSNLTVYRYQVCGVDSSGNEGPRSSILVASTSPPGLAGWPVVLGQSTSSSVGLADLDGDARPEVLVGAEYLYVVRHDGSDWVDGDQTPATVGIFSTLLHNIPSSPAVADLDLDGTPEIIAASWNDSTVAVFRTDGSLQPGSWPRKGSAPFWSVPAVGNLDGDPELEVVIGSNGQRLYAWNEDGSEVLDGDANPATQGVYFAPPGMGSVISSPAVADLNGDVQREVVFGTSAGRVYAVRAGAVVPGWPFQATGVMSSSPAIGDIIPGGGLEVAMACANDSVYVLTSTGARAPGWPRHLALTPGNGRVNSVALARLRGHLGDPSLCVVVAGVDGRLVAFAPSGATLSGWSAVNVGAATEASPAVADLEGDGSLEVLLGAEDRRLHAYRFDGTPVSGFPIETAAEVRGTPGIWDLDGDGATDIVVAGWDRLLRAWRYPGTFQRSGMAWPMFHHDGFRTGVATFPIMTGIELDPGNEPSAPAARATLDQNRPNPFNPSTTIGYAVPGVAPLPVTIRIYTVAGRLVRTLVSRNEEPGYHEARWDGTDDHGRPAASGVYLYRAEIGAATLARKMALLR
ncbi:MAG TPA: FG-GAP-like repeat-containing protein, partial [Candidatus Eisenbacteria bacterium]|nr:FG-GAP-like repeat-containing protein [Candidatus Eisenbacteria bacterium]